MSRTIAIGDIHGCSRAFDTLMAAVSPNEDDTLIPLGDFVDRGPDSRGVVDRLLELSRKCTLIPILGNHEEMLLAAGSGGLGPELSFWLQCGGATTLTSYGGALDEIPMDHIQFLSRCRPYFETDTHLFLHANYLSDIPMTKQPVYQLRWASLYDSIPEPHYSGKIAIVGHSAQRDGEILNLGHLKCIDTFCHGDGWLTALDVSTGDVWQANQAGVLREPSPRKLTSAAN